MIFKKKLEVIEVIIGYIGYFRKITPNNFPYGFSGTLKETPT